MEDLVSIIIPTYKGYDKLTRAIDSALSQTYKNIEVIVVDDNDQGTDARKRTEEIIKKYTDKNDNIFYVKHTENRGIAAAKNFGIRSAKGCYLAFLDDDDYYLENRIEKCVQYMDEHKSYVGVYTGVDVFDKDNNLWLRLRPDQELSIKELLMNEMAMGTGSNTFIKREYAEKVGGHDESFVRRTDIEFTIRLCKCGKIGNIPECLVIKAVNGTNTFPSYDRLKEVLEKFFGKFEDDIEKLGDDKTEFYRRQYQVLLNVAIYERNKEEIKESYALVKKYGGVSAKCKINAWLCLHNLRDTKVVNDVFEVAKKLCSIVK